jgi:hypothetical protein
MDETTTPKSDYTILLEMQELYPKESMEHRAYIELLDSYVLSQGLTPRPQCTTSAQPTPTAQSVPTSPPETIAPTAQSVPNSPHETIAPTAQSVSNPPPDTIAPTAQSVPNSPPKTIALDKRARKQAKKRKTKMNFAQQGSHRSQPDQTVPIDPKAIAPPEDIAPPKDIAPHCTCMVLYVPSAQPVPSVQSAPTAQSVPSAPGHCQAPPASAKRFQPVPNAPNQCQALLLLIAPPEDIASSKQSRKQSIHTPQPVSRTPKPGALYSPGRFIQPCSSSLIKGTTKIDSSDSSDYSSQHHSGLLALACELLLAPSLWTTGPTITLDYSSLHLSGLLLLVPRLL